jgi:inhibitor of cysteine peptidase
MLGTIGRRVTHGGIAAILVVGSGVLGIAGCGSDSKSSSSTSASTKDGGPMVFTKAGGDISVSTGDTFVIELESNPSTGFIWTVSQAPDAAVVTLEGQAYEKPDSSALGAPGTERFTFEAVATGTTTIALEYSRPSAPDSPDNTTNTYTVTVE